MAALAKENNSPNRKPQSDRKAQAIVNRGSSHRARFKLGPRESREMRATI